MELKDFISQLLRNWVFILVFALAGLIVAFLFNQNQKETFQASLLLYLKPVIVTELPEASSSANYYSQLMVRDFSDSLVAFLLQPEIQKEIAKKFQLKKLTPQILRLIVREEKEEQAKATILEVAGVIKEESKKFTEGKEGFFQIETLTPPPSLERIDPHKTLNLMVSLLLGLVFGILVVSSRFYLYPK